MRLTAPVLLVCALTWAPVLAFATTIRVPGDYPMISEGLGHAAFGDTVLVAPGVYVGELGLMPDGVVLISEEGAEVTVIDGNCRMTLQAIGAGDVTEVSGFTFIGSDFAIWCDHTAIRIAGNIFIGMFTEAVGVVASEALIHHNLFVDNSNGIFDSYLEEDDASTIRHNTFVGNNVGITLSGYSTTVTENNVVVGNLIGIGCMGGGCIPPPVVRCNDVWNNSWENYYGFEDPTGFDGNISADPLFCDPDNDDYRIDCQSPCAPSQQPDCGLIGALDVGCGPTATVPTTWGLVKGVFRPTGE